MLVIINCILALIFFFVFFIMLHSELHSEPSFIKLAIVLTTLLINIVCVATIISSFKYTIDIKLSDEVKSSQSIVNFKDNRDLQGGFFIGTNTMNDGIQINANEHNATIGDVVIKSNIVLGEEGGQQQLSGVAFGTIIGFGMDSSGNFIWENNGPKKTAATTDDISGLTSNISALTSRVSALEDLLKLA